MKGAVYGNGLPKGTQVKKGWGTTVINEKSSACKVNVIIFRF
jgi:hypothetical protein